MRGLVRPSRSRLCTTDDPFAAAHRNSVATVRAGGHVHQRIAAQGLPKLLCINLSDDVSIAVIALVAIKKGGKADLIWDSFGLVRQQRSPMMN